MCRPVSGTIEAADGASTAGGRRQILEGPRPSGSQRATVSWVVLHLQRSAAIQSTSNPKLTAERVRYLASLVALPLAIFLTGLPLGGPALAKEDDTLTVRDRLELFMDACAVHGFEGAVIVVRNDEILLRSGYGFASRAEGVANRPDTLFDAGSVAKQFTAAAVLRLKEQGVIKLSDPVAEHLPTLGDRWKPVTIHQLLAHASGIPRDVHPGLVRDPSRAGFLRAAKQLGPHATANDKASYSNLGYSVLAALIEVVSKKSFEHYVREQVFHRAGMTRTHFPRERKATPRCARGLEKGVERLPANRERFPWRFKGSVGVLTTVEELRAWDRALRAGQVLSVESLAAMNTPHAGRFGYGVLVRKLSQHKQHISHSGATMGFESGLRRIPQDGLLVAVLANRRGIGYIARGLELIAREQPVVMPPDAVQLNASTSNAWRGEYQSKNRAMIRVDPSERGLIVTPRSQSALAQLFGHTSGARRPGRWGRSHWSGWTWRNERLTNLLNALGEDAVDDALAYGMPKAFCKGWALARAKVGALESWRHIGNVSTQVMQYSLFELTFQRRRRLLVARWGGPHVDEMSLYPVGTVFSKRFVHVGKNQYVAFDFETWKAKPLTIADAILQLPNGTRFERVASSEARNTSEK